MKKAVQNDPRQRARSLYGVFFQIPTLPEAMLRLGNWETLASAAFRTSHAFTDEDIRFYKEAWSQPDAMTSMLNWYRAVAQSPPQKLPSPRITVPTLMIWGMQDPYLESDLAQPSIDLCDDGRLILLEDISHWVQHEAAAEVNHHLLEWLGSYRSVSTPTK